MYKLSLLITFLGLLVGSFFVFQINSNALTSLTISSTDQVTVASGGEFEVDVFMRNADRIVGFQMKLLYDVNKYELISITVGNQLSSSSMTINDTIDGEITLVYVDVNHPLTQTTLDPIVLVKIKFLAKSGIETGSQSLLTHDISFNNDFLTMATDYTLTSVDSLTFSFSEVTKGLKGDVSLDGSITVLDVARMQLAIAQLVTLTSTQTILADVNNDGQVTVMDAAKIQLFLAQLITIL